MNLVKLRGLQLDTHLNFNVLKLYRFTKFLYYISFHLKDLFSSKAGFSSQNFFIIFPSLFWSNVLKHLVLILEFDHSSPTYSRKNNFFFFRKPDIGCINSRFLHQKRLILEFDHRSATYSRKYNFVSLCNLI